MSGGFPDDSNGRLPFARVRLGEVVRHRKEFIQIDDLIEYKRCRVQLHAQGIVLRDVIPGMHVKTKSQQVCREGEFLVAEIDAKVGGLGIVPPELDGAIVSSHYFLFTVDETRLDRRFLDFYIRTPRFRDQVTAQGTTNYAAIRPSHVLEYTISLPPLAEQRRIVARIEELVGKIEEARGLRWAAVEELEALARSIVFDDSFGLSELTPMREIVRPRSHDVVVEQNGIYQFAGVYSFGRGVFRGQKKSGIDVSYSKLGRLRAGDFVYPKLMAWEGALGVVPPECDGLFVSPEFPIFEIDERRALPEVLDVYFRTPEVWPRIAGSSTGTNVRRRRLQPSEFLAFMMPLPPMSAQIRLRKVMRETEPVERLQAEMEAELKALLPAVLEKAFRGEL